MTNSRLVRDDQRTQIGRFVTSAVVLRLTSLLVFLAIWQVLGSRAPLFASTPSAIAAAFVELLVGDARLVAAFASTLLGMAIGFVIAATVGIVIGFAMGWSRTVDTLLGPYVSAFYATPRVALIPLLVLWVGVDFELRVTIVVLSAVFPIIINVETGVKSVSSDYIDTARAFVGTQRQIIRTIVIPASLPFLFAGLRIGAARALIGITVAEMTAAVTGTGALLLTYGRVFATAKVFVVVVLLGVLGLALAQLMRAIERRFVHWKSEPI